MWGTTAWSSGEGGSGESISQAALKLCPLAPLLEPSGPAFPLAFLSPPCGCPSLGPAEPFLSSLLLHIWEGSLKQSDRPPSESRRAVWASPPWGRRSEAQSQRGASGGFGDAALGGHNLLPGGLPGAEAPGRRVGALAQDQRRPGTTPDAGLLFPERVRSLFPKE